MKTHYQLLAFFLMLSFISCRKEDTLQKAAIQYHFEYGIYLLNEGAMDMNKASLDFYDLQKDSLYRDVFSQANPEVAFGLGDVGNDLQIYGSKLYAVINNSNKVEVLNKHTVKRIAKIDVPNVRYITFANGRAYISSYQGKVGDPKSPAGFVAEVDTSTLKIIRKVTVGRQPEEMAVVNNKLYVANSGGYDADNYERTVSVIDLNSFTESHRIDVGINLHRLKADQYGDLYVTSRGDYYTVPSKLFVIDTKTDKVKHSFNKAVSNLFIHQDIAYLYSTEWSYLTGEMTISYNILNIKDEVLSDAAFINDGTEKEITTPYGIAVNPISNDLYVTDAIQYVSPGTLYCFDKDGNKKWQIITGDIPAHISILK